MFAGQLASTLHLDPGTISAGLRRLEAKGLIERRHDPRDQRRIAIALTAHGKILDRVSPGTVERAVDRLLARARTHDLAAATRLIARLTTLLHDECET